MRFTYKGKTYRIGFKHFNRPGALRRTECSIYEEIGPKEFIELESNDSFCSDGDPERGIPPDNFCKATGRKYALARALLNMTQDRSFRHTAWMAYLNRGAVPQDQHREQMVITGEGEIL